MSAVIYKYEPYAHLQTLNNKTPTVINTDKLRIKLSAQTYNQSQKELLRVSDDREKRIPHYRWM